VGTGGLPVKRLAAVNSKERSSEQAPVDYVMLVFDITIESGMKDCCQEFLNRQGLSF